VGISIISYAVAVLLWPFAIQKPIDNVVFVYKNMSSFSIAIRQLFEGALQWSDVLPWYYTPKYIFMTIPIAVIVGLLLFFVCCWRKKENRFWAFFVFFTFFFPVFWIVFTHANVYGGWRHAMFAYPTMVVAAGWGFDALVTWIEEKLKINNEELTMKNDGIDGKNGKNVGTQFIASGKGAVINIASVVVLLALLIGPIRHIIANHPYEYVYFNGLAGGMDKAYGNYEMDYYYHSTREAAEWIIANAEPNADGSKIIVATWHTASVDYFLKKDTARFITTFSRWYEKGNNNWDYAIFTITGMAPEQIKNAGAFPPPDCVHTIDVDGKPICLILKRQSKIDMLGNQYKSKNQADSAILCFKEALAINPYNEAVLNNIIECYLMRGQLDSAKTYIDQELSFLPKYETANYFLAHYYMTKGEMDKAIETCKYIIDCNFKFTSAYHLMCNIYLRQNDVKNAEKALLQLIEHDQLDNAGVQQLINIYKAEGLDDRGAYRKLYKKIATSLDKRGKKKEAQVYWDSYKQLR
jgi:tetratricopeptide (TPR) repeat protein